MTQRDVARSILVIVLSFGLGTPALAIFDVQLLAGKRWYEFESEDASGNKETDGNASTELFVAAHVNPIPLVPVAFGVGVGAIQLNKDDLGDGVTEAAILEVGIDVMAWVPLVPMFTPYARINYPVSSEMVIKGETASATSTDKVDFVAKYKISGFHLAVGGKISIIPLLSLNVEVGVGQQKYKLDSLTSGDLDVDVDSKELGANSNVVLVGLELGI